MALVAGAILVYGARKYHKHEQKKRNAAEYDYSDMSLRSSLSMLVHCVYFRDYSYVADIAATFLEHHDGWAENYAMHYWDLFRPIEMEKNELKKLGLEFLLRRDPHPNTAAPRLAIVLRGTDLLKLSDLVADVKIAVARLQETNRVQRTQQLILEVVQAFLREYGTQEEICLTGHSLGGAIALQVGRYLVGSHGVAIDTHVFNPPLLTLVDFVTLKAIPRPNASYNHPQARLHRVETQLQGVANSNPADQGAAGADLATLFAALSVSDEALAAEWAHFQKSLSVSDEALAAEWAQFQKLENWTPSFYLNTNDVICHRYIKFYTKRQHRVTSAEQLISPQAIFTRLLGREAKYIMDVVPSANLYISTWEDKNYIRAHSHRQWHTYSDKEIKLENFQARLLTHARRRLADAYEKGKTMLRSPRGDKHDRKAPAFTDASNSIAAVTAAAAAGYAPFSQARVTVAGYEAVLRHNGYDTAK